MIGGGFIVEALHGVNALVSVIYNSFCGGLCVHAMLLSRLSQVTTGITEEISIKIFT